MPDPALSLIVVTHNSARWLPAFFQTWRAATSALSIELLLADSGSTDNTLQTAKEHEPSMCILECGNIGYGAAANRAVAIAKSPWHLVCNPDLLFPSNFATTFLFPAMKFPSKTAGCIAPTLLNPNGTTQPSIGRFPTLPDLLLDQFRPPLERKFLPLDRIREGPVDWAAGACVLCSREAWNAVGGFDERFFLYVEEVDFQRRLADSGFPSYYLPEAKVTHAAPNAAGAPRPLIQRYAARGLLRYFAKHGTFAQLPLYRLIALLSRRLPLREAFASAQKILNSPTGP
jgi:N-acetylglucosaminyl-diphospho-decaprenol L-rhamnosyltransferase